MDISELQAGYTAFQAHEKRDAMYKTATFLVNYYWGRSKEMSDALGVLLLTWNQAFYRYGLFDFDELENFIARNQESLTGFRKRDISSYTPVDDNEIMRLYEQLLIALQIAEGKVAGRQSPVAVSKGLHLFAPAFFPLWDDKIAKAYNCHYQYLPFLRKMKDLVGLLSPHITTSGSNKTILKLIDEYNYAKFTKEWTK
jgi:hypothetical protein